MAAFLFYPPLQIAAEAAFINMINGFVFRAKTGRIFLHNHYR
jgi:hypothetical protein